MIISTPICPACGKKDATFTARNCARAECPLRKENVPVDPAHSHAYESLGEGTYKRKGTSK